MAAAFDHVYRYGFESALETGGKRPLLTLATSGGQEPNPFFFKGSLSKPQLSAQLLFALSRVVGSRFYVPPAMLSKILAMADPIVTSGGGMLRFEGFSSCASAYARVDFTPEAYDGERTASGTTNVDFNAPMRAALASVRDKDGMDLSVGRDRVELKRAGQTFVEKKVALPVRWLKGLVEVQAYSSRLRQFTGVSAIEGLRFVRALPRQSTRQEQWLTPSGRGLRLGHTPVKGGLRLGGLERLRALETLLPRAKQLIVYAEPDAQASAWELDFDVARFTLVLSTDVWRGFSGEGQALHALRRAKQAKGLALELRACLNWQAHLEEAELAGKLGKPESEIASALAVLGSRGLVGFDQRMGFYFHRELPFDLAKIEDLAPRLRAAQKLLEKGEIRLSETDPTLVLVPSGDVVHRVELTQEGTRCTCPWYAKYLGGRGPCKHVLAAESFLEARDGGRSRS
jgi:hypothetical protein